MRKDQVESNRSVIAVEREVKRDSSSTATVVQVGVPYRKGRDWECVVTVLRHPDVLFSRPVTGVCAYDALRYGLKVMESKVDKLIEECGGEAIVDGMLSDSEPPQ